MNGQEPPSHRRYVLSLGWNAETKAFDKARVEGIPDEAIIASLPELARMLTAGNGMMPSDRELADIAKASVQRLKLRLVA
jgi:hypothetical protein